MKFSALNKEASESSILSTPSGRKGRPTKEAQESVCLQLYRSALVHQQEGKLERAKAIYREILESELMEEAEQSVSGGASIRTSTVLKLKYLIFKNLAGMARDLGDYSAAVDAYIEASSVDTSDVTLWCQLASAASLLGNLLIARTALEQALQCNARYWPAIESLCTVLFSLQDFASCLEVVAKGLQLEPQFARGLAYLHRIFASCPDLASKFPELRVCLMQPCPADQSKFLAEAAELAERRRSLLSVAVLPDAIVPAKKLPFISIYSLGKGLISIYQQCKELSKKNPSFTIPVDLSCFADGVSEGSTLPPLPPSSRPPSHPHTSRPKPCEGGEVVEEGGGHKEVKRKLWEDLEYLQAKRRSTRSKSRKKEHQTYYEMLKKYIPQWLLLDDYPEVSLLSPLNKAEGLDKKLSLGGCKEKISAVFDTVPRLSDADTVAHFLSQHKDNCGIVNLLYNFALLLAKKYDHKWAATSYLTARVFVDLFELLHTHLPFPSPFQSPEDENENRRLQELATIALCYAELYVDGLYKKSTQLIASKKAAPDTSRCFQQCLLFIEQCSGMIGASLEECAIFQLRVLWCVAKLKLWQKESFLALKALERCRDLLVSSWQTSAGKEGNEEESTGEVAMEGDASDVGGPAAIGEPAAASSVMLVVCVANSQEDALISAKQVEEKMQQLAHSHSFEQIFQLFDNGEHAMIAEKLLPVLQQESGSYNEFLLGSSSKFSSSSSDNTCFSLLLSSLLVLGRVEECLKCCVQGMVELLAHYQMGVEAWVAALKNTFDVALRCLENEGSREALLQKCEQRLLKRLVICVLKTMDIVYEMFDSDSPYFLLMPISLPWKLLYYIIACEWKESVVTEEATATPLDKMETDEALKTDTASDMKVVAFEAETPHSSLEVQLSSQSERPAITGIDQPSGNFPVVISSLATPPPSLSTAPETDQLRELASELLFLIEAHEHLGSLGWCCKDSGGFLQSSVTKLRKELKALRALPQNQRETLLLELEQCYYCLYGYPYKKAKSRGLSDHNSEMSPLTWESAQNLMEYYHPYTSLPTIDGTKPTHITSELLQLYRRIIDILPYEGQVLSLDELTEYIEGTKVPLVESSPAFQHTKLISDIYYILGDDYLRSGDNHNAIRSYLNTLTYCPNQFDSWAGLALARSRIILHRLKSHDFKIGTEKYVEKQTMPTVRCFLKAVDLDPSHCFIIEKFGFFCYAVQAFTSQILSQPELFLGEETQKWAAIAKRETLTQAESCFKQALSLEYTEYSEPWIYCLMLGKAGLKLGRDVAQSLHYLLKSCNILCLDGACYPEQVEITAKGHAMEAVEMHYQLHSSALKAVLMDESKVAVVADVITQARTLPLGKVEYSALREWVEQIFSSSGAGKQPLSGAKMSATNGSESPLSNAVKSIAEVQHKEIGLPTIAAVYTVRASPSEIKPADATLQQWSSANTMPFTRPLLSLPPTSVMAPLARAAVAGDTVKRELSLTAGPVMKQDVSSKPDVPSIAKPSASQHGVLSLALTKAPYTAGMQVVSQPDVLPFSSIEQPFMLATASAVVASSSLTTPSFTSTAFKPIAHTLAPRLPSRKPLESAPETPTAITSIPPPLVATLPQVVAVSTTSASTTAAAGVPSQTAAIPITSQQSVRPLHVSPSVPTPVSAPSLRLPKLDPLPQMLDQPLPCSAKEHLLKECLYGVAVCAVRCPAYFKPLYRMSKVLIEVDQIKVARQLLLGPLPQPLLVQQGKLQPLFVLRPNIFHNMWQIPAEEINRPGNFSTHARRNLELLLEVLTRARDIPALLYLSQNLKNKPEASKRYLRNNERTVLFKKALKCCVIVLEGIAMKFQSTSCKQVERLLLDSYSVKLLVTKANNALLKNVEKSLLTFYKALLVHNSAQEGGEEGVDLLLHSVGASVDEAVKFCQAKVKTSSVSSSGSSKLQDVSSGAS